MRILIVSQYFFPENFRINDLALSLKARGHHVEVLTAQPNYPLGKIFPKYSNWTRWRDEFNGIPVWRVPIWPRGKGRSIQLALNYLSFVGFALCFGLPRLLTRPRFDVSIVFATSPITAAIPANILRFLRGTPVAIWLQDLWPESVASVGAVRSTRLLNLIGSMVAWIYRHSDRLLIQAQGFRPSVLRWGGRDDQIVELANWAEDIFKVVPEPAVGPGLKILFAGNLGHAQALDVLLNAAQLTNSFPEISWHVMGDGSRREWLAEQILQLRLKNIWLHERRPLEEMPDVYLKYDAQLILLKEDPHLKYVLPSKVQAAMAAGMPVIASGDGELAAVVRAAKCGFVSSAGDGRALADHALKMAGTPHAIRRAMGLNGRAYFEKHYLKEPLIEKLEDVLFSISGQEKVE
jgi:colanic acid biosynthesis glycosyl transferase WcaI